MAVTLEAPRGLYPHSRYPLVDELDPQELPEAFTFLTKDELPPVFTTYNSPFMIDEEDIDFGKELKIPGEKEDEHELSPGLLPPAASDDDEEDGIAVKDFDFTFDEDFAPEEDDEYGLEHAMDEEDIPEAIPDEDEPEEVKPDDADGEEEIPDLGDDD